MIQIEKLARYLAANDNEFIDHHTRISEQRHSCAKDLLVNAPLAEELRTAAREARASRAVTGRAGIGNVPDVRHRAGAMNVAKGARATGRGRIRGRISQTGAIVLRVDLERGGLHSSRALSKSGRSGRGATAPTESDRVVRAVGPGGGTMSAHKDVATGQDGSRSGTSRNGARVAKAARLRGLRNPNLPRPSMP